MSSTSYGIVRKEVDEGFQMKWKSIFYVYSKGMAAGIFRLNWTKKNQNLHENLFDNDKEIYEIFC